MSKMPMSAWNLSGEKIQAPTPIASVRPVNTTPLPVIASVMRYASGIDFLEFFAIRITEVQIGNEHR